MQQQLEDKNRVVIVIVVVGSISLMWRSTVAQSLQLLPRPLPLPDLWPGGGRQAVITSVITRYDCRHYALARSVCSDHRTSVSVPAVASPLFCCCPFFFLFLLQPLFSCPLTSIVPFTVDISNSNALKVLILSRCRFSPLPSTQTKFIFSVDSCRWW